MKSILKSVSDDTTTVVSTSEVGRWVSEVVVIAVGVFVVSFLVLLLPVVVLFEASEARRSRR